MIEVPVKQNQNLLDIAIQHYGDVEGVGFLLADNRSISLTGDLAPGTKLYIRDAVVNRPVRDYFRKKQYGPATGKEVAGVAVPPADLSDWVEILDQDGNQIDLIPPGGSYTVTVFNGIIDDGPPYGESLIDNG